MKKYSLILFLALILGASTRLSAQAKYDKMVNASEVAYETGDYKKAISNLEKFKKKAFKKLGQQNAYTTTYYLYMAKYHLASGRIKDFETNVDVAISSSIINNKENSQKHGQLLADIAELHILNGSYRVAREYLDKSKKVLDAGAFMTEGNSARWNVLLAEALTGQGYYNEALNVLHDQEKYYAARAQKQESYVDDKGNLKSRRIPDDELKTRYQEYGRWMTDIGNAYRNQGNFNSADSAFTAAARWIDKNLGRYDFAYAKNQFYHSNLIVENGLELDRDFPKGTGYDNALNNLLASHKNTHYLAASIYEEYLKRLLAQGVSARYQNTKLEYEKMINGNYKGSAYAARLKAVEFDAKLDKDKTKNLESTAIKMLTETPELPHNNIVTARVLEFLYGLAVYKKNYANAEKYLTDIVGIKTDLVGENAPETHLARIKLANFYLDYTNKIAEAGKIYDESFTNVVEKEIAIRHKDMLEILNHIANLYELTDKYDKAIASLEKAKNAARVKYDYNDYLYGAELTNNAKLQIKLGQYEQAEQSLTSCLKILENFRKDEEKKGFLVDAIETQASLFGIKGLFDDAEDNLDRAAKIISRADHTIIGIDEASSARELASLFIQLGRYSDTEELLEKLIKDYEKTYGPNSLRLIDPLVNMGRLSLAKGDYTEADKIATRVKQIAVSVYNEKSTKTAPVLLLMGDIDYIIGDYEEAENNIRKAMESQEQQFGHNHIEVAKSLARLALIKFYKGDNPVEVEKMLLDAQTIMGNRLGKDNPQYADVLKNVAILNIAQKKYNLAFSSLTQAEGIWRAKTGSKNNINAASIFTLTGDVYYQMKIYPKAEEFYNNAKNIYEKYFSRAHPEYVKILSKLAKVYYMEKDFKHSKRNIEEALNDYDLFIKQYFPALSEREKAKYWNTMKGDFEFYNTLAFGQLEDFRDLAGKVYNYQLLTKALLLSSSIKIRERILNSTDENLKAAYNNWVQKKEFLTNALSMSSQQLLQNGIDPAALGVEVEKLEKELSVKSELFGQGFENKKITYENVQKSLGKNDVAVEMVRYRYFDHDFTDSIVYVAMYVKNDNARPKVIALPEGRKMETRYFRYYRNSITSKLPDMYSYKIFWEPIQKEIGQYATIFLSPDGVYNQINLEAVPTPDGKYVIDNSNIVIVSNTKDLYLRKLKKKEASSNTATMFGNPRFYLTASANHNIADLPGTEKEVNELEELLKQKGWKTSEYVETNASEEQVKELESPKIFHIATHGFYTAAISEDDAKQMTQSEAQLTENPLMKTGLLLKGAGDLLNKTKYNYNLESGILTAYEAMSLNLDKTDLVVLSACETGLGEVSNGEGVYGLQRAFLVAGAKVLIMSMFKVDDDATQKLILNFYKKWLATGNMRQSFVDAKKELRVEYPEPIYWGAFMMIGLD